MKKPTKGQMLLFGGIISALASPFATKFALDKTKQLKDKVYQRKISNTPTGKIVDAKLTWKDKAYIYSPMLLPTIATATSVGCQIGMYTDNKKNEALVTGLLTSATNAAQITMTQAEKHMEADEFSKFKKEVEDKISKYEHSVDGKTTIVEPCDGNKQIIAPKTFADLEKITLWQDPISGVMIRSSWHDLKEKSLDLREMATNGNMDGITGCDINYSSWLEVVCPETMPDEDIFNDVTFVDGKGFHLEEPSRFNLYLTEDNVPYCKYAWACKPTTRKH